MDLGGHGFGETWVTACFARVFSVGNLSAQVTSVFLSQVVDSAGRFRLRVSGPGLYRVTASKRRFDSTVKPSRGCTTQCSKPRQRKMLQWGPTAQRARRGGGSPFSESRCEGRWRGTIPCILCTWVSAKGLSFHWALGPTHVQISIEYMKWVCLASSTCV